MIGFKAALAGTSRELSGTADWPVWRHSSGSAEWVRSHRPAPNPLCLSSGWGTVDGNQIGRPAYSSTCSVKSKARRMLDASLAWHQEQRCGNPRWFRTWLDPDLKSVTGNGPGFRFAVPLTAAREREVRLVARWEADKGVGHPLVQKSRCRSAPKNSKIPMLWPTGRLQNLPRVNNVSKSPSTILSVKNLETFKPRQPWEYKNRMSSSLSVASISSALLEEIIRVESDRDAPALEVSVGH